MAPTETFAAQRRYALKSSDPLTLLDAARLDVNGDLKEDVPAKLDPEGFGFGAPETMARKAPFSPMSPIKSAVANSSISQPKVATVHRVRLRNFDEKGEPTRRTITRRHSAPDATVHLAGTDARRRSNSLSCAGGSLVGESSPGSRRPQSAGATVRSSSVGGCDITPEEPTMRNLNSQEVSKRNRDAAEWFRAARSINHKIRSIEETETLLSMARDRRANGAVNVRRKSKESLFLAEEASAEKEKAAPAPELKKRRSVDAADLWGAKPKAAKPKQEEAKPEVLAALAMVKNPKSCMRGNVTVGETGENGLLARLRRRKTVQ